MSVYSGTPLLKKIGIKKGQKVLFLNPPANYRQLLGNLPEGVEVVKDNIGKADFIHCFVSSRQELEKAVMHLKPQLDRSGCLWVSWPKGTARIQTDINRDTIRNFVLTTGLVDIKVASVDDNWSALKFVYRKSDR